ncbi:hypothetical protein BPC006_I3164 [Burkholderia pseudomallei BPC006]|nr:hypothetical protein BPC006_I3164 [Burkholderia pseudomallei BPC006]
MTGPADRGSGFAAMKHSGIKMGAIGVAETSDYKLDRIRFRHRRCVALPPRRSVRARIFYAFALRRPNFLWTTQRVNR